MFYVFLRIFIFYVSAVTLSLLLPEPKARVANTRCELVNFTPVERILFFTIPGPKIPHSRFWARIESDTFGQGIVKIIFRVPRVKYCVYSLLSGSKTPHVLPPRNSHAHALFREVMWRFRPWNHGLSTDNFSPGIRKNCILSSLRSGSKSLAGVHSLLYSLGV